MNFQCLHKAAGFALSFALAHTLAHGASFDQGDFQTLLEDAHRQGATRVMVTLDGRVTLADLGSNFSGLRRTMDVKAATLKKELGASAWTEGYWSNGAGQIGLYVTAQGLALLAKTSAAASFSRDPTHGSRSRILDTDGRMRAIEAKLQADGQATVQLTLNVPDLEFDIDKNGSVKWRQPTQELPKQAQAALSSVKSALSGRGKVLPSIAQSSETPAAMTLSIDRRSFVVLSEHPSVRSMQLVGWQNSKLAQIDDELFEIADRNGSVEATLTIRLPDPVVMGIGHMSARAWQSQRSAIRRAFDDVLGQVPGTQQLQDLSQYGAVVIRTTKEGLVRLRDSGDPRVLEVRANQIVGVPLLATSKQTMNMLPYWSAGFRAAGQYMVVMDTGIRKSHYLFKDASGNSRVIYELCFGTNGSGYTSPCPAQDAAGDSPPNHPGSGEPASGCAGTCPYHGTHIAGIAAGREHPQVPGAPYGGTLQGVAPDALIVSAQIFSRNSSGSVSAFSEDIVGALDALNAATSSEFFNFTAVIGVGDSAKNTADCPNTNTTMTNAIAALHSKGVPVVLGTGNRGATAPRFGIGFPACIPHVIKVAATINDASANTLHGTANIAPDTFTGPILLVPGWQLFSAVGATSTGAASDTATNQFGGASYAGPQVAGYYAVVKAAVPTWGVADVTAWVYGSGSVAAPQTFPGLGTYQFRRVRAP